MKLTKEQQEACLRCIYNDKRGSCDCSIRATPEEIFKFRFESQ